MNYFQNGRGDGVFILLLAILSVFLTLTKRYHLLLFTGMGSLAILTITFVTFQMRMSEMQSQMNQGMANNRFSGLGDAMFNTIQIQWGGRGSFADWSGHGNVYGSSEGNASGANP